MKTKDYAAILEKGIDVWNSWRKKNPSIRPILQSEDLRNLEGYRADFRNADLSNVFMEEATLVEADLSNSNLTNARLGGANLQKAKLTNAVLHNAHFCGYYETTVDSIRDGGIGGLSYRYFKPANLREADFCSADLTAADLCHADLSGANLDGAKLFRTELCGTNLTRTNLSGAKLIEADISNAMLYSVNLQDTILSRCIIHGISAWKLDLDSTIQEGLIITDKNEPEISVDNLEVAQFIYLLLHNKKIRDIIDTVANKAVLILGRFSPRRKPILDGIKEILRVNNYVPILFDFNKPMTRDATETITTLAGLSKFIIADLSDPKSTPLESHAIVPHLMAPFIPIIQEGETIFQMFNDLRDKYHWVLQPVSYRNKKDLLKRFNTVILEKAEAKSAELRQKRMLPDKGKMRIE